MAPKPLIRKLRKGGGALKSEYCGRKVPSLAALEAQQLSVHSVSLDRERRNNRRGNMTPSSAKIQIKGRSTSRNKPKPTPSTEGKRKSFVGAEDGKVEYLCPKCDDTRIFPIYYSALKHIHNTHCINSEGEFENREGLKPIRVKLCIGCNTKVRPDDHECTTSDQPFEKPSLSKYVCAGCDQTFASISSFDVHLPGMHSNDGGVETLIFSTMEEFTSWKQDMMIQMKCSYTLMGNFLTKQLYRCSDFVNDISGATVHLCPSTIMFQKLTEGIQVHFYKQHSGHDFVDYSLKDKYALCSLVNILQQSAPLTNGKFQDGDLFSQFTAQVESVVLKSAKANVETLKELLGKAHEMNLILNNLQGVGASGDDQDETELETGVPAKRSRRKSTLIERDRSPILQSRMRNVQKRVTKRKKPQKTSYTYSLAINSKDSEKILMELDETSVSKPNILRPKLAADTNKDESHVKPVLKKKENSVANTKAVVTTPLAPLSPIIGQKSILTQSPSSFNDSYKDFVGKTLLKGASEAKPKKVTVKTKMGQFKPSTSPKNAENVNVTSENANESSKNVNVSSKNVNVSSKNAKESSKNVNVTSKNAKESSRNVNVTSKNANFPRKNTAIRSKRRKARGDESISFGSVKDVTYEVMERENDCNILILKM